jgi:hypothetical protein
MEVNLMKTYSAEFKKLSSKKKLHILREWQRYLDEFATEHSPFQQVIYTRLFWLSIGQGKKTCRASYEDLKKICNIKSDATLLNNIEHMRKLGHVDVLEKSFAVKTKYRVFTPLEVTTPGGKGGRK